MANLRVVHENIASTATITASDSAATTNISNIKKQQKSYVWRSATKSTNNVLANIKVVPTSMSTVGFVGLFFNNTTSSLQVRVRGYIGTEPSLGGTVDLPTITATGTLMVDTGWVYASPAQNLGNLDFGVSLLGENSYSGRKSYARIWIPVEQQKPCTSYTIELMDYITSKYIEVGNLVMGNYWSPKYNTSFGLSTSVIDTTDNTRTESGDLISTIGIKYNTMNFDLKWLSITDRMELKRIFRTVGKHSALFISLFPDNSEDWEKEMSHQIYGKLKDTYAIEHPVLSIYSSKIEIEEI